MMKGPSKYVRWEHSKLVSNPTRVPPLPIVERLSQTFFVPQSWKFKGPTAAVIVMLDDPRWRQLQIIEFHDHTSATIKPLHFPV